MKNKDGQDDIDVVKRNEAIIGSLMLISTN